MAETTDRHGLSLLQSGQSQKEITHNEALVRIDALLHAAVESRAEAVPPSSPIPGAMWIVADGASGEWAGQAGRIACFHGGGWSFIEPVEGCLIWSKADALFVRREAASWIVGDWPVTRLMIEGQPLLSRRQPAIDSPTGGPVVDTQARAALDQILAALRTHGLIDG